MHASRPTFTHTRTRTRTERRPRQSDHVTASSPASAWTQQSKHIIVSHSRCSRPENQNGLGGFEDAPTRPRKAARRTCPRAFPYSYATARASRSSGGLVLLLRSLVRRPSVANSLLLTSRFPILFSVSSSSYSLGSNYPGFLILSVLILIPILVRQKSVFLFCFWRVCLARVTVPRE